MLIATKYDREKERVVGTQKGKALIRQSGCSFLETSAKNRISVGEVFYGLVREINRVTEKKFARMQEDEKRFKERSVRHMRSEHWKDHEGLCLVISQIYSIWQYCFFFPNTNGSSCQTKVILERMKNSLDSRIVFNSLLLFTSDNCTRGLHFAWRHRSIDFSFFLALFQPFQPFQPHSF